MKSVKKRGTSQGKIKTGFEKKTFYFTLVLLHPEAELSDKDADALYEAGCSDALVGSSGGEILIGFHREAPSFRIALMSAITDVERSGVDMELIRVEPEPRSSCK